MKKMNKLAFAIGALVLGNAAFAAIATGTLDVSANIAANCVFAVGNATLPFGALTVTDLANGKNETATASVKITCANSGAAAKLYSGAPRAMSNGTDTVTYDVYTEATRAAALGSTKAGGADVVADGTEQTITLWGKTTAGQGTKSIGTYTQALALTVEF